MQRPVFPVLALVGTSALVGCGTGQLNVGEAGCAAWQSRASLPNARFELGAASVGSKLYAIGGNGGSPTGELDEYDPATDAWTPKTSMPTARQNPVVAVVDGRIYVTAGYAYTNPNQVTYFTTTEAYDPATDTWTTKAPIPAPGGTGGVLANLYLGGGAVGSSIYVAVAVYGGNNPATLIYDTVADSWSSVPAQPLNGSKVEGVGLLGDMYLVSVQTFGLGYEDRMALLDPTATVAWSTHGGPPTHRSDEAVAASASRLFVVGGAIWQQDLSQSPPVSGALDAYDPARGAWSTLQGASTPRAAGAAAVVGDTLYFLGGWTGSSASPIPSSVVESACVP
jgi:N-acetylneuraminic acid mutarotase